MVTLIGTQSISNSIAERFGGPHEGFGGRGLLTQWNPMPARGARPQHDGVLLADPGRSTRETLTGALVAGGLGRIIVADSVAEVDNIVDSGVTGHLALLSLGFGDTSVRLIHALRRAGWLCVVALAPTANANAVLSAMEAGACGVLRGHPQTPVTALPHQVGDLTDREIQVLVLVAAGLSNKKIATRLELSALTVKSHLARISRKLNTGDRAQMVALALRAGVIS